MHRILGRRRTIVALFVILTAAAVPGLQRLEIDNSPEAFFVDDDRELERYRRFARTFSDLAALRLVLSGDGLWSTGGLAWVGEVESELQRISGVSLVAGPALRFRGRLGDWPPEDPAAFRRLLREDVVARESGLVADDGAAVSLLVAVRNLSVAERRGLLGAIDAALARAPAGIERRVVGLPLVERALDRSVQRVATRFFPLLALLTAALLAAALRSPADVGCALVLVGVTEVGVLGAMGWAGARLNVVVAILPPILLVLSLGAGVHLLLRFREHRAGGRSPGGAVAATYREKGWPVLWAGITTAAGFGSLATSRVPPVRDLGLWTAAGIGFLTLTAFTLYPALLASRRGGRLVPAGGFDRSMRRFGAALGRRVVQRRRLVLALFAVAAVPALAGLPRLRPEGSVLAYLAAGHPLRAAIAEVEGRGLGVVGAELLLARGGGPSLAGVDARAALGALAADLRREPLVLGAVSVADLPGDAAVDDRFLRAARGMLETRDGELLRVALAVSMLDFQPLEALFDRATRMAERRFPGAEVWVTGRYPLVLAARRVLTRTMWISLSLTLVVVAAVLILLLRRPGQAIRALLPNLWPVLFALGAMGWVGIPMDGTTVMIAAVVLGLAVDDTLHYLGDFRGRRSRMPAPERAWRTLERTAGAHVLSSAVLAAGFAICGLSEFVPVARFGRLAAAAIVAALAADLLLVPALFSARGSPGGGVGPPPVEEVASQAEQEQR